MFRNSDHESIAENANSMPVLLSVPKTEPVADNIPVSEPVEEVLDRPVNFVEIKNREVFDYEPKASSIHASMWPHWWLKAVHSRHKLRKTEAKKNVRFRTGLMQLFREALEVGTILFFKFKSDISRN